MSIIYPEAVEKSSDNIMSEAQQHFQRTSKALNSLLDQLEAERFDHVAETKTLIRDLKAAMGPALAERERLESEKRKEAGIGEAGYALDFAAARLEVGRRLACLRAARSEGSIPE